LFISSGTSRRRTLPGPSFSIRERTTNTSDGIHFYWYPWSKAVSIATGGTQITESDYNRWPLPKEKPTEDHGSEFYTLKQEVITSKFPYSQLYFRYPAFPDYKGILEGSLIANCFDVRAPYGSPLKTGESLLPLKYSFPPDLSSTRAALNVKGATAVAACSPVNQIANAASSIGELLQKHGVPNIPGLRLLRSRLVALQTVAKFGEEFLNVEFGILPTISDGRSLLKGMAEIDIRVDQFIRDSGRDVRRKFVFPKEITVSDTILGDRYSPLGVAVANTAPLKAVPGFPSDVTGVPGSFPAFETRRRRTVERETWFSGAFTYHIPDSYDTNSKSDRRRLMAKLLGAQPDLNTLWQLAPWSWAIDWFSDAGTFVKNLQSYLSYGSILRYGYVMETTTVTDTFYAGNKITTNFTGNLRLDGSHPPWPVVTPITLRTTVKKRVKANPFGFGISWDGLSPVQLAIAAALGITRVVR